MNEGTDKFLYTTTDPKRTRAENNELQCLQCNDGPNRKHLQHRLARRTRRHNALTLDDSSFGADFLVIPSCKQAAHWSRYDTGRKHELWRNFQEYRDSAVTHQQEARLDKGPKLHVTRVRNALARTIASTGYIASHVTSQRAVNALALDDVFFQRPPFVPPIIQTSDNRSQANTRRKL